jgi:hypothetical protein
MVVAADNPPGHVRWAVDPRVELQARQARTSRPAATPTARCRRAVIATSTRSSRTATMGMPPMIVMAVTVVASSTTYVGITSSRAPPKRATTRASTPRRPTPSARCHCAETAISTRLRARSVTTVTATTPTIAAASVRSNERTVPCRTWCPRRSAADREQARRPAGHQPGTAARRADHGYLVTGNETGMCSVLIPALGGFSTSAGAAAPTDRLDRPSLPPLLAHPR